MKEECCEFHKYGALLQQSPSAEAELVDVCVCRLVGGYYLAMSFTEQECQQQTENIATPHESSLRFLQMVQSMLNPQQGLGSLNKAQVANLHPNPSVRQDPPLGQTYGRPSSVICWGWFLAQPKGNHLAVAQHQWYHFGVGAPPVFRTYFNPWPPHFVGSPILRHPKKKNSVSDLELSPRRRHRDPVLPNRIPARSHKKRPGQLKAQRLSIWALPSQPHDEQACVILWGSSSFFGQTNKRGCGGSGDMGGFPWRHFPHQT